MGKQCYDMENYDGKIMQTIQENSGCSPVMWLSNRSEPLCKTIESFQKMYAENADQVYRLTKDKNTLIHAWILRRFKSIMWRKTFLAWADTQMMTTRGGLLWSSLY